MTTDIDLTTARPSSMKTTDIPHQFIVIEGPIGVGKSTLARRLCASMGAEAVLEQAAENPFLERFYRNPRDGALPAQLYFLFQRAQQLAALNQQDMFAPLRVADYLLEKDRLFARVTLDDAEFGLYEQEAAPLLIVNAASIDPINNQADYDELLAAIQRMKRGRLYYNPLRSRGI
jgi:deoxyguanosine kinase